MWPSFALNGSVRASSPDSAQSCGFHPDGRLIRRNSTSRNEFHPYEWAEGPCATRQFLIGKQFIICSGLQLQSGRLAALGRLSGGGIRLYLMAA
jgi:hypothetical protein